MSGIDDLMDEMYLVRVMREQESTLGMSYPVRCNCGQIYDMGRVEVYARYADCSCWMTPCCHRHEDDRPWTRKYTEIAR
jgi:hypothetical protein